MTGKLFPRSFKTEYLTAVQGEGIYIYDKEGKKYLDGCSGALICNLGHCNEEIIEAVMAQMHKIEFAHTSRWRLDSVSEAAEEMASLAPAGMEYVWFTCGGSEAIEAAVKLARQYYTERDGGYSSKSTIISRWNAYHGSTLGTMAIGGSIPRRRIYAPLFKENPHIAPHYCYRCPFGLAHPSCDMRCARHLEEVIKRVGPGNVMAFIAEPIVGSSVGALVPPDEYWPLVREICTKYDILLIADEVMTGMGRTGKNFCVNHWGVKPDIIATAKGMAAGYIPTGGVIASNWIAEEIQKGTGAFTHGHTYTGNPLSGAATAAVIKYMKKHKLVENVAALGIKFGEGLKKIGESNPIVGDVRGKGFMWGFELVRDKSAKTPFAKNVDAANVAMKECLARGLVIYPGGGMVDSIDGDNFLVAPPLITTSEQIDELLEKLELGLAAAAAKLA